MIYWLFVGALALKGADTHLLVSFDPADYHL